MAIAGIDVSSDYTRMGFYQNGAYQPVAFEDQPFLPCTVAVDGRKLRVGQDALDHGASYPDSLITGFLEHIGTDHQLKAGKKAFEADALMTLIFKAWVEREKQWEAVLTVPAHFNDAQRATLKQSAQAAGLRVHRLLPKPTASAIAHYVEAGEQQTILVVDMGQSFFEVSLLEVSGSNFRVLSVEGGSAGSLAELDRAFAADAKNRAGLQFNDQSMHSKRMVRFAARIRDKLASRRSVNLAVPAPNDAPDIPLGRFTREDYMNMAQPHLEQMAGDIIKVITRTGRNPEQVDRFMLTGSGARNRAFQDFFRERLEKVAVPKEPETLAVRGAAMVGARIDAESQPLLSGVSSLSPALSALKYQDVIPHSLGVAMKSDKGFIFKKMRYVSILEKDKPYPAREAVLGFAETLWTERLIMKIYRGESEEPDENEELGRMIFPVSRAHLGKNAVIMACIFQLDSDGILTFTAVEMPLDQKSCRDLERLKKTAAGNDLKVPMTEVDLLCDRYKFKTMALTIKAR